LNGIDDPGLSREQRLDAQTFLNNQWINLDKWNCESNLFDSVLTIPAPQNRGPGMWTSAAELIDSPAQAPLIVPLPR